MMCTSCEFFLVQIQAGEGLKKRRFSVLADGFAKLWKKVTGGNQKENPA